MGKDGANDMVVANTTAKIGKDSSTNMTPMQVVEDSQKVVSDDVNVDFVATQVLVTYKEEEPISGWTCSAYLSYFYHLSSWALVENRYLIAVV